ncbi:MAG: CPBP family intramembrane metalloprotease [Lachnospiraceae bacterium]|nr:CPBP family intramembrane metalloprotease [Lachnospiraceae bacterium]
MRKTLNKIGLKYGIMGITYVVVQLGLATLLNLLLKENYEKYAVYISFGLIVLTVDCICFPMIYLLTMNMPKGEVKHVKFHFGHFLLCVLCMYGLIGVGAVLGLIFHTPLSVPFEDPEQANALAKLMLNSNFFVRLLVVGILAPIFEELIFRKILVDHVAVHGELPAILLSGLMFGLFHGNFQQGFFTCFIGCMFAYVYIKTGKIIYTILLHMTVNCATSVITIGLYEKFYDILEKNNIDYENFDTFMEYGMNNFDLPFISMLLIFWVLLLITLCFAGLITLIVLLCLKKIKISRGEEEESVGKQIGALFTSPGLYLFYAVCAFLFFENYVPPIIVYFKNTLTQLNG